MKNIQFEYNKIYFFDYAQGYIIRFREYTKGGISVISSFYDGRSFHKGNKTQWASNDLMGPKIREATYEEMEILEKEERKAGIKIEREEAYNIY